jgi:hypothetical protein
MAFSKKRAGIKVPLETIYSYRSKSGARIPLKYVSQISCDGGFGEVFFEELVDYVLTFLDVREKQLFSLMVRPPDELLVDALQENARRQKIALMYRSYGSRSIKISCRCLRRFLIKKGSYMSEGEFFKILHSVKGVVKIVLNKEEDKLPIYLK